MKVIKYLSLLIIIGVVPNLSYADDGPPTVNKSKFYSNASTNFVEKVRDYIVKDSYAYIECKYDGKRMFQRQIERDSRSKGIPSISVSSRVKYPGEIIISVHYYNIVQVDHQDKSVRSWYQTKSETMKLNQWKNFSFSGRGGGTVKFRVYMKHVNNGDNSYLDFEFANL